MPKVKFPLFLSGDFWRTLATKWRGTGRRKKSRKSTSCGWATSMQRCLPRRANRPSKPWVPTSLEGASPCFPLSLSLSLARSLALSCSPFPSRTQRRPLPFSSLPSSRSLPLSRLVSTSRHKGKFASSYSCGFLPGGYQQQATQDLTCRGHSHLYH